MQKVTIALFSLLLAGAAVAQEDDADILFGGLKRIEGAPVGVAYINPDADFSVFRRVAILDPYVAFRANWQRDVNRDRSRNVSARDMERIQADMQSIFRDVFTERLEAAGFDIVSEPEYDVLVLRPAIVDLDITAPDAGRTGRSRTFTSSSGSATLYLQLVDSVSGDLLGRAADRAVVRSASGNVGWTNRVTNRADARRVMRRWADVLVNFLTSHYYQPEAPAADGDTAE